jgi:hypothetical protein
MPPVDGRSRVPEILAAARGQALPDLEETMIAHLDQAWARPGSDPEPTVAVAEGSLRYVRIEQEQGRVEQLYDSSEDALELHDRSREDPETLARLSEEADAYLDLQPDWGETPTREISELELNHLRALGYAVP